MKRIETQVDLPAVHRLDHRGPRDPQPLRDPCLRHALRSKPPDQRPVFQSDHSPIVECSPFTAETVQFSSAVDIRHPIACHACPKTLRSHGVFEAFGSQNGVG